MSQDFNGVEEEEEKEKLDMGTGDGKLRLRALRVRSLHLILALGNDLLRVQCFVLYSAGHEVMGTERWSVKASPL